MFKNLEKLWDYFTLYIQKYGTYSIVQPSHVWLIKALVKYWLDCFFFWENTERLLAVRLPYSIYILRILTPLISFVNPVTFN